MIVCLPALSAMLRLARFWTIHFGDHIPPRPSCKNAAIVVVRNAPLGSLYVQASIGARKSHTDISHVGHLMFSYGPRRPRSTIDPVGNYSDIESSSAVLHTILGLVDNATPSFR